jgi:hypothetical protein
MTAAAATSAAVGHWAVASVRMAAPGKKFINKSEDVVEEMVQVCAPTGPNGTPTFGFCCR